MVDFNVHIYKCVYLCIYCTRTVQYTVLYEGIVVTFNVRTGFEIEVSVTSSGV